RHRTTTPSGVTSTSRCVTPCASSQSSNSSASRNVRPERSCHSGPSSSGAGPVGGACDGASSANMGAPPCESFSPPHPRPLSHRGRGENERLLPPPLAVEVAIDVLRRHLDRRPALWPLHAGRPQDGVNPQPAEVVVGPVLVRVPAGEA